MPQRLLCAGWQRTFCKKSEAKFGENVEKYPFLEMSLQYKYNCNTMKANRRWAYERTRF